MEVKMIKMKTIFLSAFLCCWGLGFVQAQKIVPKKYMNNESFTYDETIKIYKELDARFPDAMLVSWDSTDAGKPLHTFIVNTDEIFDADEIRNSEKSVLMIMNGIHPGEPDGIDASLLWLDDLLHRKNFNQILENVILVVIPVYNIDGMLNRGCCSRANQNGPTEYGFRGNAKNLDLNRDFMKQESKNMQSFAQIFRKFDPDIFIDTHVSNGADYPYTFTLLHSSGERLPEPARSFHQNQMLEYIYENMRHKTGDIIPYVNVHNEPPDNGFKAFYDSPRYSSGYASLYGSFAFTAETHMLKPYAKRVDATIAFFETMTKFTNQNSRKIQLYRNLIRQKIRDTNSVNIRYVHDDKKVEYLKFNTYAYKYEASKISNGKQLKFDTNVVIEKNIPYTYGFKASYTAAKPQYFVIPYAYSNIVKKLQINGIKTTLIHRDTLMDLQSWYIPNVEMKGIYEGRPYFQKKDTNILKVNAQIPISAGSSIVKLGTDQDLFIMNALHPLADDSYLIWGYFAAAFEQKEYFSSYIFDSFALQMLENDANLRKEFEEKKLYDKNFANDHYAQLDYLYKKSIFAEKTLNLYPIYFKF